MNLPFLLRCGHVFCHDCKRNIEDEVVDTCYDENCKKHIPEGDYEDKILDLPENIMPKINTRENIHSSKLNKIISLVQEIKQRNEQVLIFSQWSQLIYLISTKLQEDDINIKNVWIDGTCDRDKRNLRISEFQDNDKNITVLLATYKVGGVGLNLVNANNVILADMWWNPSVEDQAVDRTHRMGQTKEVNV